jgi:hypothetical protein
MNVRDLPLLTARIRGLQAIYATEHARLVNWGNWSWDRRGIFPTLAPPSLWNQFKRNENEDYGEEQEKVPADEAPKTEPLPPRPYEELPAVILDERLHAAGGPAQFVRHVAKVAYVSREVPEEQFARLSGCSEDAFCERLEALLVFVRRFV